MMAVNSVAYDLSRFEVQTVERRAQRQSEPTRIERVKSTPMPASRISPIKAIACLLLVVAVASALLYTHVSLTERVSQVSYATEEYTKLEAEGVRLNMELEGMVSLENVEEYAQEHLGMTKKENKNVEYVRLNQENKIEVADRSGAGFWDSVVGFFSGLLA